MKEQALNILLIDNNTQTIQQVMDLLGSYEQQQCTVTAVEEPERGLSIVTEQSFDVVLLGFKLGPTNALEWLELLSESLLQQMAVLILSNRSDDPLLVMECLDRGALDFIEKDSLNEQALFKALDNASYCVKTTQQINDRMIIEEALSNALNNKELTLHYQPIIDAATREIVATEALLRWQHSDLGCLSPAQFIPVAEDTGLINSIGRWVIHTACRQSNSWREQGVFEEPLLIAVNVSHVQLKSSDFIEQLADLMCLPEFCEQQLVLEVTEQTLMSDPEQMLQVLKAVDDLGVYIAIDDFGSGYTSLTYLAQLPVYMLKIAPSFVSKIGEDKVAEGVVKSVIDMGRNMGLKVAAEGVETQQQADYLAQNQCDMLQGFLLSKPQAAKHAASWLENITRS